MVVLKGLLHNNLYCLKGITVIGQVATSTNSNDDFTQLWHLRLRHAGEKSLQAIAKQGLLKDASTCKLKFYEHCIIRKKTKVRFGTATHCTEEILDYVNTDLWGSAKISIGGNHYFKTFIDGYSRRCWVCTMKHKEEVMELFAEWKRNMENSRGRKIKILHSDNEREYTSDPFLQLYPDEGIEDTSQ